MGQVGVALGRFPKYQRVCTHPVHSDSAKGNNEGFLFSVQIFIFFFLNCTDVLFIHCVGSWAPSWEF